MIRGKKSLAGTTVGCLGLGSFQINIHSDTIQIGKLQIDRSNVNFIVSTFFVWVRTLRIVYSFNILRIAKIIFLSTRFQ